jgi:hypothetical protein
MAGSTSDGKTPSWAKAGHISQGYSPTNLWPHVRKTETCWYWTGAVKNNGYGEVEIQGEDRQLAVHRVTYEMAKGRIPDGMVIDHLCRNTVCVNPDHMEVVTNTENLRRGNGFNGVNARKTHCIRGHPLSGDNVYIWLKNGRECRGCKACKRERYWRKKNPN